MSEENKKSKKIEKLNIQYVGIQNPETSTEVEIEIAGLELAKESINYRIATLRQGLAIAKHMEVAAENEKTVTEDSPEKTEQKS